MLARILVLLSLLIPSIGLAEAYLPHPTGKIILFYSPVAGGPKMLGLRMLESGPSPVLYMIEDGKFYILDVYTDEKFQFDLDDEIREGEPSMPVKGNEAT